MIKTGKQYKYVINILSIEDRPQNMMTILEPFIFKLLIKMLASAGFNVDPIATTSISL